MSTKFDDVLHHPVSGRSIPLILDHTAYGSRRLLRDADIPWTDPLQLSTYMGRAQGLLRPDATLVDVGAAYEQHLASRPDLVVAMGARSRTGYALRTLLADDAIAEAVVATTKVLSQTSVAPLVLQVPAPLRWLAAAQLRAGGDDVGGIEPEYAENAAMYLADWLRRFSELPIALLLLDGRRGDTPALAGLAEDKLSLVVPVANVGAHYRWGLALRTDTQVRVSDVERPGVVLGSTFWNGGEPPAGPLRFATVPRDAEPEAVLERIAVLA